MKATAAKWSEKNGDRLGKGSSSKTPVDRKKRCPGGMLMNSRKKGRRAWQTAEDFHRVKRRDR